MTLQYRFICLLAVVALVGCDKPKEGCIDVVAKNLSVGSELACKNGCCQYPSLALQFTHIYGGAAFNAADTHTDAAANAFRIDSVAFFLSDMYIVQNNGNRINTAERVSLYDLSGNTITEDAPNNYALINSVAATNGVTVGTTRHRTNDVATLHLQVGIDAAANKALPTKYAVTHPLTPRKTFPRMYNTASQDYNFLKIWVKVDTNADGTPDTQKIFTLKDDANRTAIDAAYAATVVVGKDIVYGLNIDYQALTNGILFKTDNNATVLAKLKANIPTFIYKK